MLCEIDRSQAGNRGQSIFLLFRQFEAQNQICFGNSSRYQLADLYIKSPSRRSPQIFTKKVDFSERLCYTSFDAGV
jgi:hypothetical protein